MTKKRKAKKDWKMNASPIKTRKIETAKRKMMIATIGLKLMHLGEIILFVFLFDHLRMNQL